MFYDVRKNDHGLPHDPFKAIVAPRPIGWITSMSKSGEINLAPYSWFNGVSSRPPMVMFSSEERKDSLTFIEETKEFVYELKFPEKTDDSHEFVEHLWARRKVGFMLDQIRANGENPELVKEIVILAKKYGRPNHRRPRLAPIALAASRLKNQTPGRSPR